MIVHAVHTAAEEWGGFGNCVVLDVRQTPYYLLYAHLSIIGVAPGQRVTTGVRLGLSGATGKATGPHLHEQCSDSPDFPRIGSTTERAFNVESFRGAPPRPGPGGTVEEQLAALWAIVGGGEAGNYNLLESVQRIQRTLSNHKHTTGGPIE